MFIRYVIALLNIFCAIFIFLGIFFLHLHTSNAFLLFIVMFFNLYVAYLLIYKD